MKNHYERVICLCCFLIFFVNIGLPSTSFNIFQPYIAALPDVGNTGGSLILTVRTAVSFVCLFLVRRYVDAVGARKGAALAASLTGVGFLLYSLANTTVGFFAGALFCGAGYGLGGSVIVTLVIRRWFDTGVGTAMGIATMGSSMAALLLSPLVARIIENASLTWGFRFEAILAFAIALTLFLLLRDHPAQMGREPYRSSSAKAKASSHTAASQPLPRKAMMWLFTGTLLTGAVCINAYNYFSILLVSQGIDTLHAATLVALMGLFLTAGKFIGGFIMDRIGTLKGTLILFAMMISGLVLACFCGTNPLIPYLSVLLFGLGVTLGTLCISLWSMELSTNDQLTSTVKNLQVAYGAGGFLLSMLPGTLMDLCGSYAISYAFMAAVSVVGAAIITVIYRRYRTDV